MTQPNIEQLDELAQSQRDALEAALEEMVNSGFGDLHSQLPPQAGPEAPPPTPRPAAQAQAFWAWW